MARSIGARGAAIVVFAAMATAAVGGSPAHGAVVGRAAAKPSFLYVLQAREGWVTHEPNGHWRLSLRGVSVFEFSDRPERVARELPTRSFVAQWKRLFGGSPPNGAFVVQHAPPGQAPTAVEIFKAFWEQPGQLALCMCTIGSQPRAVSWLEQLTRASASRHGEITLFIDNGPPIRYAPDRARRRRSPSVA
jgi:hypothetical protein